MPSLVDIHGRPTLKSGLRMEQKGYVIKTRRSGGIGNWDWYKKLINNYIIKNVVIMYSTYTTSISMQLKLTFRTHSNTPAYHVTSHRN